MVNNNDLNHDIKPVIWNKKKKVMNFESLVANFFITFIFEMLIWFCEMQNDVGDEGFF